MNRPSDPQPHPSDVAEFDQPEHAIPLTATLSGTTISVTGNGDTTIPLGQGATHIKFELTDNSGQNVQFAGLDTADGITTCPPLNSGNNSSQVVGVTTNNNGSPKKAQFTDNNSNHGTLYVSYQWSFTCNAGYTVLPFDPVITNNGKTGPMGL